jgi:hypothetical protein
VTNCTDFDDRLCRLSAMVSIVSGVSPASVVMARAASMRIAKSLAGLPRMSVCASYGLL